MRPSLEQERERQTSAGSQRGHTDAASRSGGETHGARANGAATLSTSAAPGLQAFQRTMTVLLALAVLLLLVLAVNALLAFAEPPALIYPTLPNRVLRDPVAPGQAPGVEVRNCTEDPLAADPTPYSSTSALVSDDGLFPDQELPGFAQSEPRGTCSDFLSYRLIVPVGTPAGRYHFVGQTTAQGRYRTTVASWYTTTFSVLPAVISPVLSPSAPRA